jgi:CD109 antigen
LFNKELQAAAGEGVGLTAHVLLAFLSVPSAATKYSNVIQKATDYIVKKSETIDHLYSLAIAAYTLQKMGHASAADILKRLDKRAIVKNGLKWWEYYPSPQFTHTVNIEITSIILSTYANAGLHTEALPILHWLTNQRNSRGGYTSTQDTILAIEALTKMASKLYVSDTDVDVKIRFGTDGVYNVKLDRKNIFALQSYELPLDTKQIKIECKGNGLAVAQVAYMYYVLVPEPTPRFNLDITIRDSLAPAILTLTICTSFIVDDKASQSGMTIVEVAFPSGYTFNRETLAKLRATNNVLVIS